MTIDAQPARARSRPQPTNLTEAIQADIVSFRTGFAELVELSKAGVKASEQAARALWKNRRVALDKLVARARAARAAAKQSPVIEKGG